MFNSSCISVFFFKKHFYIDVVPVAAILLNAGKTPRAPKIMTSYPKAIFEKLYQDMTSDIRQFLKYIHSYIIYLILLVRLFSSNLQSMYLFTLLQVYVYKNWINYQNVTYTKISYQ